MVKLLIDRGADKEAKIFLKGTPLHFACAGGHLEVVKLLIELGAEKEAKGQFGWTPLHFACPYGNHSRLSGDFTR